MSEESDQETTDLGIESRTWNKLETAMKLFGFREGAVKGKSLSLQEGFNVGYLDGFKLGEYLGMTKGILNCESEFKMSPQKPHFQEEALNKLLSQPCAVCLYEKNSEVSKSTKVPIKNVGDLIKLQQSHSKEIIQTLKNSDLKPHFETG